MEPTAVTEPAVRLSEGRAAAVRCTNDIRLTLMMSFSVCTSVAEPFHLDTGGILA